MTTQTLAGKLEKEVDEMKDDLREMKKFLFSPLTDPEGEYRESFVKKMLTRSQSNDPFYTFSSRESFLKHVRGKQ